MGTVHAWSLFLEPLEGRLGVGRGTISAVYSVALVAITVAVLVGHRLFRRAPGWMVVGLASGGAAVGLLVAAWAPTWWILMAGYGVAFGAANGLGYAFALQRSAEANPDSTGMALGLTTAAYALGAALAALLLDGPIVEHGPGHGLRLLALVVAVAGAVAMLLVGSERSAGATDQSAGQRAGQRSDQSAGSAGWRAVTGLWVAYGLAVLAGLMVLGHAAAIVEEAGGRGGATVVVAGLASAAGGVWMARTKPIARHRLVVALPSATAGMLVVGGLATTGGDGTVALVMVAVVAAAYGAVIAVYPAVIHDRFGVDGYPSAYGRMFTAWGVAGLVGPVGAGLLFEMADTYRLPILLAAVAAASSGLVARRVTSQQPSSGAPPSRSPSARRPRSA